MPASLVLKTIELAQSAPRKGFAVVTASTYDGRDGVQITDVSLPPVSFKRSRQKGWTYHFAGDGLLIHQWDETPDVFGYTVFLTITSRLDKALEIAGKSTRAAGSLASTVGLQPVGAVLTATDPILTAVANMAGASMVGALTGSERDESGTQQAWTLRRQEGDVTFTLSYAVS